VFWIHRKVFRSNYM